MKGQGFYQAEGLSITNPLELENGEQTVQDEPVLYEIDFPFWITVAFTLNYVVGSGFLTLPWAFEQAGVLLGVLVLLIFGFFSVISVFFILESMSRAWKLDRHSHHYRSLKNLEELDDEAVPSPRVISPVTHLEQHIRHKKEITELCQIFLGDAGKHVYFAIICIYMYASLWAYTSVFANSFSVAHGQSFGEWSYRIFILIFSCVVVPLSTMEFSEQVYLQVSLAIFRIVMLIAMTSSILVAYFSGTNEFQLPAGYESQHTADVVFEVDWSKLYVLTPVAAYAFIFHHSVPALAEPIADRTTLNSLFQTALVISMMLYIALGMVVSAYFGTFTLPSSNLNWKDYIASDPLVHQSAPIIASIVRTFVLLFPAVDVASAFPLNAFTLGNNIMTAYYGKDIHRHEGSRFKTSIFRLLAAIPPIIGASFIQDLGKITSYAGLTGFALAFVFPPVLSYVSRTRLEAAGINAHTIHSSFWTNDFFKAMLFFSGMFLIFYVGYLLATS